MLSSLSDLKKIQAKFGFYYIDVKSMFFIMCLHSLVVIGALERYSKDLGSSPGEIHVFHFNKKLLPVGGRPCKSLTWASIAKVSGQ